MNKISEKPLPRFSPGSIGLLAPLEPFFQDESVSEILMNRPQEIFVERQGRLEQHDCPDYDLRTCTQLFQLIASENAQILSEQHPILSGSLRDGSRVQLVLPPTAKHPTLSIRRQVVKNLNLEDYEAQGFYQNARGFDLEDNDYDCLEESEKALLSLYHEAHWDAFMHQAIALKKNIVISGGTSSGKTTYLNACLRAMNHSDRIIVLEDTREIDIPHPNQVSLLASASHGIGNQAAASVSMQALVQCCLRLRPDRIIMGEIRGREILDFLGACSTGHEGSLTSIHANNPRVALMRMTQLYKQNNVPSMTDADILRELHEVIDVIVQLGKTPQGRRVQSVYYRYGHLKPDSKIKL